MSRYIDADKLKDNFCDACATLKRYGRTVEECRNKTDSYGNKCFKMRLIDAIPTADVEEVRHGEWKDRYENKYANHYYECSVCKGKALDETYVPIIGAPYCNQELSAYCPHCGASMGRREE